MRPEHDAAANGPVRLPRDTKMRTIAACVVATIACSDDPTLPGTSSTQRTLRTADDCPVGYNLIEGSPSNDTLRGTQGSDCILGYEGEDYLRGRGGDDYLVGGEGADIIYGNAGDDFIHGERGDDYLRGGSGQDAIRGGGGDDDLRGNGGNDVIRGGNGDDVIRGGNGDDELHGDDGDDELNGNDGDDVIYGGGGDDAISDGLGDDTIIDGIGDAAIALDFNAWPVVESIVPIPTSIPVGGTTYLTTNIWDPDEDALSFHWSADCLVTFDANDVADPVLTLADENVPRCTLTVDVSDGRGGEASGSITITTEPTE